MEGHRPGTGAQRCFGWMGALLAALVRARAAGDTEALEALWDQAVPWAPGGAGRLKGTARARR